MSGKLGTLEPASSVTTERHVGPGIAAEACSMRPITHRECQKRRGGISRQEYAHSTILLVVSSRGLALRMMRRGNRRGQVEFQKEASGRKK